MGADRAPLSGKTVIVTRSEPDNASLTERLGDLGAMVIPAPMVEVVPPADGGDALHAALDRLADYRWVVLTSVNGVEAVRSALGPRLWPRDVIVAPVGPKTEVAARAAEMTVQPAPPKATAAALAGTFPECADEESQRVLAPLAELAGSTIVDGLVAKGYQVDRVDAYGTLEPRATGEDKDNAWPIADAVTFFSPSAVDRYLDRFGVESLPSVVVCIGPSTAAQAAARGVGPVTSAAPHTETGVIEALVLALEAGQQS